VGDSWYEIQSPRHSENLGSERLAMPRLYTTYCTGQLYVVQLSMKTLLNFLIETSCEQMFY